MILANKQLHFTAQADKNESSSGTPLVFNISPFGFDLTTMGDWGIGGNIGFGKEKVHKQQNSELVWCGNHYDYRRLQFYFRIFLQPVMEFRHRFYLGAKTGLL